MENKIITVLKEWYQGNIDLDNKLLQREDERKRKASVSASTGKRKFRSIGKIEKTEKRLSSIGYNVFSVVFCLILSAVFIATVIFLPHFADEHAPTVNEVYEHYVGQGREETGAVNTVAGMILDYRAFDTLGESFVLFTATCAVLLLLENSKISKHKRNKNTERFMYKNDVVAMTSVRILFPVILIFGTYILFNGHISPGGGFSGGAILGAGFILYAMVFGEEKAAKLLSPAKIRVITACSLTFYCLAKGYSFFTGNEFNNIHSVITPGTPGNFLSGGFILPLNIAVGLVVCCTMYSFYMLFRRGRLD